MGIGLGVVLLLIGLVLLLDVVSYDFPYIEDDQLGLLLVIVGALTIVLALVWAALRSRRSRLEEHHYNHRA